ncbi:MAG: hypothetical protein HC936_06285 [Leptolyngbyaceae cyanobacterium SU_3_3]|nr:hypothetical protein [Leptolyngbyaceae cyanobacterium SU_3_3]
MTSQKDQTQALIDEIDGSLQKVISRLPWAASGQITQQRHLLQRIRSYLVMQQRSLVRQQRPSDPSEVTAKQVMQSVVQDMNDLRSSLLKTFAV